MAMSISAKIAQSLIEIFPQVGMCPYMLGQDNSDFSAYMICELAADHQKRYVFELDNILYEIRYTIQGCQLRKYEKPEISEPGSAVKSSRTFSLVEMREQAALLACYWLAVKNPDVTYRIMMKGNDMRLAWDFSELYGYNAIIDYARSKGWQ